MSLNAEQMIIILSLEWAQITGKVQMYNNINNNNKNKNIIKRCSLTRVKVY